MRDLRCVGRDRVTLDHHNGSVSSAIAWHRRTAYIVSHSDPVSGLASFTISAFDLSAGRQHKVLSIDLVALGNHRQIRSFDFLADGGSAANDEAALCLTTAGGDIVLVPLNDDSPESAQHDATQPQIMGSVEQGILAASWSLDEETIVLIVPEDDAPSSSSTIGQKMLVMSREFEVLDEKSVRAQQPSEQQVNVGWGSKRTQFHGSAGKSAAQQHSDQNATATQSISPLPDDDGLPYISWRGDCAYFVVSSLQVLDEELGTRRIVRTFDRSGNLTAVSDEDQTGLTHVVAMKPSGNLYATSQRFDPDAERKSGTYADGRKNRHDIVFFERNGLRRGGFSLREEQGATVDGSAGGITEPPLLDQDAKSRAMDSDGWQREHRIVQVQWNCDADCLAVWLRRSHSQEQTSDVLQIWTMANWHWYLKQEIVTPATSPSASLRAFKWSTDSPLEVLVSWQVLGTAPSVVVERWSFFATPHSQNIASATLSASNVAVTDGGVQRVTYFDRQTIPPPMCSVVLPTTRSAMWRTHLELGSDWPDDEFGGFTARDKAWWEMQSKQAGKQQASAITRINILALLHPSGSRTSLYAFTSASPNSAPVVSFLGHVACPKGLEARQVLLTRGDGSADGSMSVSWLGHDTSARPTACHLQCTVDHAGSDASSPRIKLSESPAVVQRLDETVASGIDDAVLLADVTQTGSQSVLLHCRQGAVFRVFSKNDDNDLAATEQLTTLSNGSDDCFCPTLQVVPGAASAGPLLVGLTRSNRILCTPLGSSGSGSSAVVARDANSLFVSPPFLVWTNTAHEARFLPLASLLEPGATSDTVSLDRRVERGSRIVTAVPRQMALILQMPRGNLERVFPRCMVLDRVRRELDRGRYRAAFLHCRQHRVDLNLLYDHNPSKFLSSVSTVVNQIDDVDHLNLFLSSLKAEDVTQTLYRPVVKRAQDLNATTAEPATDASTSASRTTSTKVNAICDAFIADLTSRNDNRRWLNSILTAHVKKQPADYESALTLLKELKDGDEAGLVDAALEYIIFLAPFDSLFDVALGMYDLTLALMVAQHSKKKDPREYLPFLRELRGVSPIEMQRFRIDDHLRRYSKAFRSLATAPAQQDDALAYMDKHGLDALAYMDKHRLYADALQVWSSDLKRWRQAQQKYGAYLLDRQRWTDAALAFQLAGDIKQALSAMQSSGSWQEAFTLVLAEKRPSSEVVALAKSMAARLEETARYAEAGRVKIEYGRDVEGAIECYVKARDIGECRRICSAYGRPDLVETNVKGAALAVRSSIDDDVHEMSEQLHKQTARINDLFAANKRRQEEAGQYAGDDDDNEGGPPDNIDVQSDTSTQITRFTRYTKATSHAATLSSISASVLTGGGENRSRGSKKKSKKEQLKEERKKASGKKGSAYEEDYLYDSLQRLVKDRLEATQDDVGRLIPQLVLMGPSHRSAALALQKTLSDFETKAESAVTQLQKLSREAGSMADELRMSAVGDSSLGLNTATPGLLDLLAGATWMDKTAQRKKLELAQKKWKSEMLETTAGTV